jgi:DNA-binding response OmpR family regulator
VAQNSVAGRTILAVFSLGEDRTALERIFEPPNWRVQFAWTLEEACAALRVCTVGVVISESHLPGGHTWKDLLAKLQSMQAPPLLVVADHLADDRLWAEVLNLGGYDLLALPLDAREVLRTVTLAYRSAHDRAQPGSSKSQGAGLS